MKRKTAFIGHRNITCDNIENLLKDAILTEIKLGCKTFTMGTHGYFDKLCLSTCRKLRKYIPDIEIEVAITSFAQIKKIKIVDEFGTYSYSPYDDVKTIMHDIEETYFKARITESNKQMINDCDTLICFVSPKKNRSGARTAMNYAKKKGLKIINLYDENLGE